VALNPGEIISSFRAKGLSSKLCGFGYVVSPCPNLGVVKSFAAKHIYRILEKLNREKGKVTSGETKKVRRGGSSVENSKTKNTGFHPKSVSE
jgi:hypothetical protein